MKRTLLWILLLGLGVRMVAIDHSLPYRYVPDTHMIRGALGMAKSKDLAPPAGKYTSYPYLMPYVLLPEFALLYVGGRALGVYESADDFGAKIVDDPTPVYLIARVVVMLFGLFGVGLTWRIARRAGGRQAAWVAAYLVATSFLLVHLGKSARAWVPLTTMVLFCGERSLAWARSPTHRRAMWMGVTAGLAMACHQAGGLAVLLPASAALSRLRRDFKQAATAAVISAALFGVTAVLVGFPYLLKGGDVEVGVRDEMVDEAAVNLGGQSLAFQMFGLDRLIDTALGFATSEPALLILLALGLCCGSLSPRRSHYRWVLLVYPLAVLAIFLPYQGTHVRYLSPAVPFLAVLAGLGARSLLRSRAGMAAFALLLALPLVQVLRLDFVLAREDTRTEFLRQIAAEVPAGARVALEGYGPPLRVSREAVDRALADGKWASRAEEREAAGETPQTADRPPYDVIPIERYYQFASVWPHQYGDPGDPNRVDKPIETFLDEMGAEWLIAVDRHPGGPRNSALDEVLDRRGERVAELAPYASPTGPGEAKLPMDPERPLWSIWRVQRPGPYLALWKLHPKSAERTDDR